MKVSSTKVQNSFGKYLEMAKKGKSVYIEKNGKPIAILKGLSEEERFYLSEEAVAYRAQKKYTYEEFLEIADREDNEHQYELIDGEIYMLSAPAYPHQVAVQEIAGQFYNWFKDKECRSLFAPFDVKLFGEAETFEDNPNVVQPDILVLCDEENMNEKGKYEGIPVLVVEVLSPSTRSKDIMTKANLYMSSGVAEYWIVDTDAQRISLYYFKERKLDELVFIERGEDAVSRACEGLAVHTDDIFLS